MSNQIFSKIAKIGEEVRAVNLVQVDFSVQDDINNLDKNTLVNSTSIQVNQTFGNAWGAKIINKNNLDKKFAPS